MFISIMLHFLTELVIVPVALVSLLAMFSTIGLFDDIFSNRTKFPKIYRVFVTICINKRLYVYMYMQNESSNVVI